MVYGKLQTFFQCYKIVVWKPFMVTPGKTRIEKTWKASFDFIHSFRFDVSFSGGVVGGAKTQKWATWFSKTIPGWICREVIMVEATC